ncbi:hypothetical protein [Kitasatospora sp. NPDC094015]|uniref:hypothetical protein n=1 Tax=Kitasatospora sp. NPDC094015 TaxID=3155205 RepID=UPI00332E5A56
MSTAMMLLLAPLVLAAVLLATVPARAHRHRGPRAAIGRHDASHRARHARHPS